MLKKVIACVTSVALVASSIAFYPFTRKTVEAVVADPTAGWDLVWSDEFNGNSLDTNVWTRETGGSDGGGWGNNELQYYTDRTDNSYVSDGTLKLVARRENYGGCRFTSARLKTAGKKSFKYGKMEARIRVEGGNQDGVWPAFWMMGDDGTAWPHCGELDIMEHANGRNYVEGTIHWGENGSYDHVFWGSYSNGNYYWFNDNVNNGINGWHTYGVTWDDSSIKWYVDDNVYLTAYLGSNNAYAFQKAHYFLLNLALGSNATPYTGNVAPNDSFNSATMYVDYVRAYSYNGSGGSGSGSGSAVPSGYTNCNNGSWVDVGAWRYFVGDGAAAYKGGGSLNDFSMYMTTKPGWDWGVQAKPEISLEANTTYNYSITATSSKATGALVVNRDLNGNGLASIINQGINAGTNTYTGSFTTGGTAGEELVFDLANIDSGTTFSITNLTLTKQGSTVETTAAPATTAQPREGKWESIGGANGYSYYTDTDATVVNVQNPGWTEGSYSGDGVYMNVPEGINSVSINGNNQGYHIEGAGVLVYLSALNTGTNTVSITYGGNKTTTVQIKNDNSASQETTKKEETTAKQDDGYTAVPDQDTTVGDFILYAANDSWTTGSMSYKGSGKNMDMTLRVDKASGEAGSWGLQLKYPVTGLDASKTYDVAVNYNSSAAGTMLVKVEEGGTTDGTQENVATAAGTTNYTRTASGSDQYQVVLELSGMPVGTVIDMNSITFTAREEENSSRAPETKPEETTAATSGEWVRIKDDGGLDTNYYYDSATTASIVNIQSPGFTTERGIYANVPAGISGVTLNGTTLDSQNIQGAGVILPLSLLKEGENTAVINYAGGSATVKVKYEKAVEQTTKEATTAEPTTKEVTTKEETTKEETTEEPTTVDPASQVAVKGYQISTKNEGYRVVCSVEPEINGKKVISYGVVYAIRNLYGTTATSVTDEDMVVGSSDPYVVDYVASNDAILNGQYGDSTTATYFAQVMTFGKKNTKAFNTVYGTRAYALLEDGTYVYSGVKKTSVFALAKALYDGRMMTNYDSHNYLYEQILKVVEPTYKEVEFDWSDTKVDPSAI